MAIKFKCNNIVSQYDMQKVKINARIPQEMYDTIQNSEYNSITECITEALTQLFEGSEQVNRYIDEIQLLKEQLRLSNERFESSTEHQDTSKIDFLEAHITDIKEQLQIANDRHEGLERIHQAYMMQVQPLMKQKELEGAKTCWWKFWE